MTEQAAREAEAWKKAQAEAEEAWEATWKEAKAWEDGITKPHHDRCPHCAMKIERQVHVGMDGQNMGLRYYCGTIYAPHLNKVTVEGEACAQMQRMRAAIYEACTFIDGCSDAGTSSAEDVQLRLRCALLTDPYRPGSGRYE